MALPYDLSNTERVESKSTREASFKPWKDLIEQLYVHNRMHLKDLMEHMQVTWGFNQTTKPWKTQLKDWGFKHHLTVKDAAHCLRCLNRAPQLGYQDAVLFSGLVQTREDILKYIHRTRSVTSEQDLLSKIKPEEPTPPHIKYLPVDHTPPLSGSPSLLIHPVSSTDTSPMIKPLPSPVSTPRSSEEFQRRPISQTAGLESNQHYINGNKFQERGGFGRSEDVVNNNRDTQQAIPNLIMPFKLPDVAASPLESLSTAKQPYARLPKDFTVAGLSATPIDLSKLGVTPTDERYSLGFDSLAGGDYTRCSVVNNINSFAALFVSNCLYWCYCVGQVDHRFQEHADYHFQTARFYFTCMLQDTQLPGEQCLEALSVMTALFDCLGHTKTQAQILTVCDEDTRRHFGDDNPLTKTIAFMKNFLGRRQRGERPQHDLIQLEAIYRNIKDLYPNSRGPALTARYNLAWAMLEMRRFQAAKDELAEITVESRAHFGHDHIQTIMAAATLARATLYCGNAEQARNIIVNEVCPSVHNNFPQDHPYTWEANHRQAFFLRSLAEGANGDTRYRYLMTAEELLREVVIERYRVLGDANPKSSHSFQLLKRILQDQGKSQDAANLWAWCQYKLKRP